MTTPKYKSKPGFFIFLFLGVAILLPMLFEAFYKLPSKETVQYAEGKLLFETAPKKKGHYLKLDTGTERYACTIPRSLSTYTCYSMAGVSAVNYYEHPVRIGWVEQPLSFGGGKIRAVVSIEVAGKHFITYEDTKIRVDDSWTKRAILGLLLAVGYGMAGYFFFGRIRKA